MDTPPHPKRFKHQSYNETLREVHLPSNFQQSHEVGENDSHFHEALNQWRQLNLSQSFLDFARQADLMSASMPLLLHNWRQIYELWLEALKVADDEGLRPLLDLLQKLSLDLRTTLSPVYSSLLHHLFGLFSRTLSAQVLTFLMETLSSLFKYLLIPAVNPKLLDETWNNLCSVLPTCLPEIQRAVAEVWAGVLRRLKPGPRDDAILLLATTVGIDDAATWIVVFSCKSVSQTLHTSAPSIFTVILNYYLSSPTNPKSTRTLLRRALTALIHHVGNADHFSILSDTILQQVLPIFKQTIQDVEQLKKVLVICSILLGVRQGSRLTDAQKLTLFAELSALSILPELHSSLSLYITSLFLAGDMSMSLSHGLKFLQSLWNPPSNSSAFEQSSLSFALKLHLCLADAGWAGWKLIGLPLVFRSTVKPDLQLIDSHRGKLISFVAILKRGGKLCPLADVDPIWKKKIETVVLGCLKSCSWKAVSRDEVLRLNDLLEVSSFCSAAVTMPIIDIISSIICECNGDHAARIAGRCMQTISQRETVEWADKINLGLWTRKCVEKWSWLPEVLEGLFALAQANPSLRQIPITQIYPALSPSLLSHSRRLRLACLRLLNCKLIDPNHDHVEVVKRCLQGEEVPIDVQGVRERVLRIGRVGQVVGDEKSADLCGRWLIAQLKVNLRPLWSPSASALSLLGQRFGDLVWGLLFEEIGKVTSGTCDEFGAGAASPLLQNDQDLEQNEDDPWEEERSWRDPSAHSIRQVVAVCNSEKMRLPKESTALERFDVQSYEHQLLSTLAECSSLVEKHNRDIVSHFLSLIGNDPTTPNKLPKTKLIAWLTLFSKFSNPKALYATETLRSLYFTLLSHPDRSLQNISLFCLSAYKPPSLILYEERIKGLLDDTRWRDELTLLDIDGIPTSARSDAVDVIIRVLFGVMLERRGHSRTGGAERRSAVLSALAACTDKELGLLVDLMLKPIGWDRTSAQGFATGGVLAAINQEGVSEKQLVGFLTLLGDVLKNLGSKLAPYWPALLGATINIIAAAHSRIEKATDSAPAVEADSLEGDEDPEEALYHVDELPVSGPSTYSLKVTRSIRQLGVKRFTDFFRIPTVFDFTPYMPAAFELFITERLSSFDKENTQAPSALLELFHSWTIDGIHLSFLVDFNRETLPKIFDCLIATNVKPSVISKIFDIVENIIHSSAEDEYVSEHVLKPFISRLLANLSSLMEKTKGSILPTTIGQRQIAILSEVSQYSTELEHASTLLAMLIPLLRKPPKVIPDNVKVGLVKIVGDLIRLIPDLADRNSVTFQTTYRLLSQLFLTLRSRPARMNLVSTFSRLTQTVTPLCGIADLLESLNSYSVKRLDEPDFDRRLQAFASLNENLHQTMSPSDWLPVIYNMLYFIQDAGELATRTNASFAMRHFIDRFAAQSSPDYDQIFLTVLYPGLKNGLRTKNEQVRAELLEVLAYSVEKCEHVTSINEMKVLLEGGDEEANFFNNVLHVQVHRRSRALRRLADYCNEGHMRSSTINEIFIPLVGNFISVGTVEHNLVDVAITTTGQMAKRLSWSAFYALVRKYLSLSESKDESQRVYVRTLVSLLENFHFPMDQVISKNEPPEIVDDEGEPDQDLPEPAPAAISEQTQNATVGPIGDAVNLCLLPKLLSFLDNHDPNTENQTRILAAAGIVAVAKHLPMAAREAQITRLLTILSQILRSRSQEMRDLVRDSLNRIFVNLGPSYLPILFRELRASLTRGPHLHVLAHVTHSIISHVTTGEHASTLDNSVNDVVHIAAEVIFGESGKDLYAEDFKSKMREVRGSSSRGLDSFSIIAKNISPSKISSLLAPVKAVMHETLSVKVMGLVDEVLKRTTVGLNGNHRLVPTELLTLCNTLISQNAKFLQQTPLRRKNSVKSDVIVQVKRRARVQSDHYSENSYRFVVFGLNLLHTALKRNRFDFQDSFVLAKLEAMVVVVGNTLYSKNASVLTLGIRCAAGLCKCPLNGVKKSILVIVRQILDILKQVGTTESDLSQTALTSLAVILRDGPPVQVKEKDLEYLLELVSPDLEEQSRQASAFALLRAIVARKFVVPEIYDLMERVSEISVTSQSPQVQELCRVVLLQFLLDYPQGKGRLRNQMTFFAKNLSYVHESGRTSVMELLNAVILKFQAALIEEYAELLFVALAMVIANDDSSKCREMAAQLIKNLWSRSDEERKRTLLSHVHNWTSQTTRELLVAMATQVYGLILDVAQVELSSRVPDILDDLNKSLQHVAIPVVASEDRSPNDIEHKWQLPYHTLTVLSKMLNVFPNFANQNDTIAWKHVTELLLFPHSWVRTAACRLVGLLFNSVPVGLPSTNLPADSPLSSLGMREVAKKLTQQLKGEHLDETLSLQVVKNLFYIGKCFGLIPQHPSTCQESLNGMLESENAIAAGDCLQEEHVKTMDQPLPWLFSTLSYQIRSAHIARTSRVVRKPNWSQQPLACLRWFAAMASYMEPTKLETFLVHILTPVYRLTEDDTVRDAPMEELKTTAVELQDLIQGKVGVTKFSSVYSQIRRGILEVRRERKVAKVLQAATKPEAAAKRKIQRNVIKKENRKRKERGFIEARGKIKRRRAE